MVADTTRHRGGRPRGSGYQTVRLAARSGRMASYVLLIGRALDQALGCPARVDLARRGQVLVITPGDDYAISGRRQDVRPRLSIGAPAVEQLGLDVDNAEWPARVVGQGSRRRIEVQVKEVSSC